MSEWWEDAPKAEETPAEETPNDEWWKDAPQAEGEQKKSAEISEPQPEPEFGKDQPDSLGDDWWASAPEEKSESQAPETESEVSPVADDWWASAPEAEAEPQVSETSASEAEPATDELRTSPPDEIEIDLSAAEAAPEPLAMSDDWWQASPEEDSGATGEAGSKPSESEDWWASSPQLDSDGKPIHTFRFPHNVPKQAQADSEQAAAVPEFHRRSSKGREKIRVSPELLDKLVNDAGEVSIYRARLEQQTSNVGFNLSELDQTIIRLREQLRLLELETEIQIIARHETERESGKVDSHENFDPLEMDEYSTLQQLSRALSETVGDLSNIGGVLDNLVKDTDTLLLQQSRLTNDLQSGLMQTRMTEFVGPAKRLERVVRTTAQTVGKNAVLQVEGSEGELDRTIIDRIMGPLEHLLRNAVAHGVEDKDGRQAAGKDPVGRITLSLYRDAGDVVLEVSDDGAGMNSEVIRKKAIERGMLDPKAEITPHELYQFILEPGFSTAEKVSQVAGRGVGMDAVLSEVKQLGGSISITSEQGKGSVFTIRLPYTLAISECLLVSSGDEVYAVPHSSIKSVIRVPREDLQDGFAVAITHEGINYEIRYLGAILSGLKDEPPAGQKWYPFLLVDNGESRVAVRVDSLLGNRNIVVKSVGVQLGTVRWITGGTILPDGRVALIIDMNGLVRSASSQAVSFGEFDYSFFEEETLKLVPDVLVVDDSITVRKVTTRLLERNGYNVKTAKDGVDALTVLDEFKPDLIISDVEMPRMDGFELARHIQRSEELSQIPIIMITSRTGEKHRQQGLSLGVREYMGKPFKEDQLIPKMEEIIAASRKEAG